MKTILDAKIIIDRIVYACDIISQVGPNPSDVVLRSSSYIKFLYERCPLNFSDRIIKISKKNGLNLDKIVENIVEWSMPVLVYYFNLDPEYKKHIPGNSPKSSEPSFILAKYFVTSASYFLSMEIIFLCIETGYNLKPILEKNGLGFVIFPSRPERKYSLKFGIYKLYYNAIHRIDKGGKICHISDYLQIEDTESIINKLRQLPSDLPPKMYGAVITIMINKGIMRPIADGERSAIYHALCRLYTDGRNIGTRQAVTKYICKEPLSDLDIASAEDYLR